MQYAITNLLSAPIASKTPINPSVLSAVHPLPPGHQCLGAHLLPLESGDGYLSSLTAAGSKASCTWTLKAQPGQRLNLTLLDFGVFGHAKRRDPRAFCHRYAIVGDGEKGGRSQGPQREVTVCAGTQRTKHVYLSKTSTVSVQLFRSEQDENEGSGAPRFLLRYQGKFEMYGSNGGCKG